MQANVGHLVGRSDIVLQSPNLDATQAMPLGNGRLGIAIWAQDGLTAQLNRADTLPYRYATGQVVLPGLSRLTAASDYNGWLDLYDGAFVERGTGMSLTAYVQPDSDTLVFDIAGADPARPQTAILKLWPPRTPRASIFAATGMLVQSWKDDTDPGASGRTFGSLSAITADGRNVSVSATDERTITLTATPYPNGHLRIFVSSPHYEGAADTAARAVVRAALTDHSPATHVDWWHRFWHRAALIKITSPDGAGEYLENLRNLYLYSAAAESSGDYPGSQAGVADLFSSVGDQHMWDPSAFWHWNLRMQVGANLGAGLPELNLPYFKLYRDNLTNIEAWTKTHMNGAPSICIPETMRFNGQGIEHEAWVNNGKGVSGWNCDLASDAYYNRINTELKQIPELPRTLPGAPGTMTVLPKPATTLLPLSADSARNGVIADSYKPTDPVRNFENIGLEPVWPYGTIGDTSPFFDLARRTYLQRPNRGAIDWSFDPVHAARLGFADEVRSSLIAITAANQRYVNGFARWGGTIKEFYVEQTGVVTLALQEALVQDYDGMIRIAPAVPASWDMEGSVAVRKQTRVDVQVRHGVPSTVGLLVKISQPVQMRNPWPSQAVHIFDANTGVVVLRSTTDAVLHFAAVAGHTYRAGPAGRATVAFATIDGVPAQSPRRLGPVQIGLDAASPTSTKPETTR